jgi:hypothetical protein
MLVDQSLKEQARAQARHEAMEHQALMNGRVDVDVEALHIGVSCAAPSLARYHGH